MLRRTVLIFMVFGLCACKPPGGGHTQAILGAVLIDGNGGPPLTDSVVIVSGDRIAAAGRRSNVPIPAEADKIDGSGKYLVPRTHRYSGAGQAGTAPRQPPRRAH